MIAVGSTGNTNTIYRAYNKTGSSSFENVGILINNESVLPVTSPQTLYMGLGNQYTGLAIDPLTKSGL